VTRRRRIPRPRRPLPFPVLPEKLPPHVLAFVDQVAAGVAAGELPYGQAWHLDILSPAPGSLVCQVQPRLCSASVDVDCDGLC
jgi:hypothetical protein